MAFNPFNVFRRNQKTLFAILTVFVMFMFVLSFGKGDFFESIPRWLGKKRGYGEVIAVVDGSKVYESDLSRVRTERVWANQFMSQAMVVALRNNYSRLEQAKGLGEATKSAVDMVLDIYRTLTGLGQSRFNPQMLPRLIPFAESQLSSLLATPTLPKDDLDAAKAARDLLNYTLKLATSSQGYFQNQPNQSNKDLLEFDLWLRKADKLGIDYTANDARDLVVREFSDRFTDEDFRSIEADFQKNKQGYSKERLEKALADEFKVRAAQTVLLGPITDRNPNAGLQAFSSPYEQYQYFREQCVGATYGVLAVPVENFVPQVSGEPSEGTLRELFDKYRRVEPNPASETPGLKEPRKLKLGWLEVRGDEPFYKTAAADALKKADIQAKLAGFLVAPVGPAAVGYLAAPAQFLVPDPALAKQYEQYRNEFESSVRVSWIDPSPLSAPLQTSILKPANLAAAAGAAAGSILTGASPLTPLVVFEQRVKAEDRNARARVAAALFAPPVLTDPIPIARALAATARLPRPPALPVVRAELETKVKTDLARTIAQKDLEQFQTEMAKLGAKKDKAEVKAYLDGFVKARLLKLGGSQRFDDQYNVGDDPGLAPLKEKMDRGHMFFQAPVRFGPEFFFEAQQGRAIVPATSLYSPQPYPYPKFGPQSPDVPIAGLTMPLSLREGEPGFLVWRTEEIPAEAPKSFDQARGKVLALWKELQARDLAKQAAEQLAKEAEKFGTQPGTVDREVRDLHEKFKNRFPDPAARDRAKYFVIPNVCPIPPTPTFGSNMMLGRSEYEPFQLRATKDLPYPTPQMEQELLKNKDKPVSTTLVLPDQGKHVYYVAVLKDHRDIGVDEFFQKVYAGTDQLGDIIKGKHRQDEERDARQEAVNLLKAEFHVEKESPKLSDKTETSFE